MPKVTRDHLDSQRERILDAAERCFAARGLRRTTMRDILTEAGMSAGGVYRYFQSKHELVAALVQRSQAVNRSAIQESVVPGSVRDTALRFTERVIHDMRAPGSRASIAQDVDTWAEVPHDPELARIIRGALDTLVGETALALERAGNAPLPDARAAAQLLIALGVGLQIQQLIDPDLDRDRVQAAARALAAQWRATPDNQADEPDASPDASDDPRDANSSDNRDTEGS